MFQSKLETSSCLCATLFCCAADVVGAGAIVIVDVDVDVVAVVVVVDVDVLVVEGITQFINEVMDENTPASSAVFSLISIFLGKFLR